MAEAGALEAITVSTQMAWPGHRHPLGVTAGDRDEVAGLGGLLVIGMGRHASSLASTISYAAGPGARATQVARCSS